MTEFLIIGAGIAGLTLGRELSATFGADSVVLLEKSKGLGGRLATRRGESTRFDHGTPEIPPSTLALLGISSGDFVFEGATSLAKHLSLGLRVEKNQRVSRLTRDSSRWILTTDEGKTHETRNLILTAPLPQALELLQGNAIRFPESLLSLHYEMAVVALLQGSGIPEEASLVRFQDSELLTLANEQRKGISIAPAWTVTFSPAWSKTYFELSEDSLLTLARETLQRRWPDFSGSIEIKKWRYSRPESSVPSSFEKITEAPALYLAGDAFSLQGDAPGIERSIRSALALSRWLQNG
jgi:predicted NAD/FAD-dependent oxidoreductase